MWTALADVVLSLVRVGYSCVNVLLLGCILRRLCSAHFLDYVWNPAHQEKLFCLQNSSL